MITEDMDGIYRMLREFGIGGSGLLRHLPRSNSDAQMLTREAIFIATQNGDGWNSDDPHDFLPAALRHAPRNVE